MGGCRKWVKGRVSSALLLTAIVVLVTLLLSGVAFAAPPWSDAPNSWWVSSYGITDTEAGTVADGYPDGTFRPGWDVTRAQFAKMAGEGFGIATASPASPTFSDVPPADYYYPWIEGGVAVGIIAGFGDGRFGPYDNIIRQQANRILGDYLAQKELVLRGHIAGAWANYASLNTWFMAEGMALLTGFADYDRLASVHAPATAYLIHREVVEGIPSGGAFYLGPGLNLTRSQAVALILRVKAVTFSTAVPTVTQVNPSFGPVTGGNSVVITGTNFTDVTSVKFGSKDATSYVVDSATQITAVAPPGTLGATVDVTVVTPAGTSAASAASKYTYGVPTVTSVVPGAGPVGGGNSVVITGTNFTGVTSVKFGTKDAMGYAVNSANQITAVAPSGTSGTTVDVTVTTAAGTSATSAASKYSYGPPVVTSLDPAAGPAAGGNSVVITGTGFTGVTAVKFGTKNATSYVVNSHTQITAVAPSGTSGTIVNVLVTTGGGTSATSAASKYSYGPPSVTSLDPSGGPTAGGNTVVIGGFGFTGVTAVKFGTKNATSYVVDSTTQITAVAPPGTNGTTVDVTVTTPGGTSATSAATKYSYGIPTVTLLTPAAGPAAGGNSVIITGTNFFGVTTVKFGTVNAVSYVVNSATKITAVAPPGTAGTTVDVTVTGSTGTSLASAASKYSYGPPVVTSLDPAGGPATGGNIVVITGTGFTGVTAVKFGGVNATSYAVNSPTQITALAPPGANGTKVDVTVTTPAGTSATDGAGDDYRYGVVGFWVTMSGSYVPLALTPKTAGVPFAVRVTAVDWEGNWLPGFTGTVVLTSNAFGGSVNAVITAGGRVDGVSITPTIAGAGDRYITATWGSVSTASASGNFTVNPGTATSLVVSAPATATVTVPFTVTVTAQDTYGNTATGYTGTIAFSSDDPGGETLPGNYTFTGGDAGTHTFTNGVTLVTAGSWSVTATDTVTSSITGSDTVNVAALTLIGSTSDGAAAATGASCALPSGTTGDLMIALVQARDSGSGGVPTPTGTPTGWIFVAEMGYEYANSFYHAIYYRVRQSGDSGNVTWDFGSTIDYISVTIADYRGGFDPADPLDTCSNLAHHEDTGNDSILRAGEVATTNAYEYLIFAGGAYNRDRANSATEPSGFSEDVDLNTVASSSGYNFFSYFAHSSIPQAVAGLSGDKDATMSDNDLPRRHAFLIALNPLP